MKTLLILAIVLILAVAVTVGALIAATVSGEIEDDGNEWF